MKYYISLSHWGMFEVAEELYNQCINTGTFRCVLFETGYNHLKQKEQQ